ncbi:MAG: ComEC/Rec2 family competence protein [Sphingobacteriia bacterium]|nr:ComEC/Rec2 family competence protein [Sphingobacteriia bacterium]
MKNLKVTSISNRLISLFYEEQTQWILWIPVLFGSGILYYFSLNYEPSIFTLIAICIVNLLALYFLYKNFFLRIIFITLFIISFGTVFTSIKANLISTYIIPHNFSNVSIVGQVNEITNLTIGARLTIKPLTIDKISNHRKLKNIKVSFRTKIDNTKVGDIIKFKANLSPPSSNTVPGGYNLRRVSYFQQISAIGYAISDVTIIKQKKINWFNQKIEHLRQAIANRIYDQMGKTYGPVFAALIIGETSTIPVTIFDNMRNSGLSHILAVSGMHLSLVVAICFLLFRNTLALIPNLSERIDLKKLSGFISILISLFYLFLSGAHTAAIRAFIMSTLIVLSIIFDRSPHPIRSLSLAAFIILLMMPDVILKPSFQMSFAAVLALISFYEIYTKKVTPYINFENHFSRIIFYFFGIVITSLLAGIATSPFSLYHFNSYANYGILANLFAIPLVSFIIMPLTVSWLTLYFVNIEYLISPFIKYGIILLTKIADLTSALPGSVINISSISSVTLCLLSLGFIWLTIWKTKIKIFGILLIISSLLFEIFIHEKAFLIVLNEPKNFIININGYLYSNVKSKRNSIVKNWHKYYGKQEIQSFELVNTANLSCDNLACTIKLKYKYLLIFDPILNILNEDYCKNYKVIINLTYIPLAPSCKNILNISEYNKNLFLFNASNFSLKKRIWD